MVGSRLLDPILLECEISDYFGVPNYAVNFVATKLMAEISRIQLFISDSLHSLVVVEGGRAFDHSKW